MCAKFSLDWLHIRNTYTHITSFIDRDCADTNRAYSCGYGDEYHVVTSYWPKVMNGGLRDCESISPVPNSVLCH